MSSAEIHERLYEVLRARQRDRPEDSYVVSLLDGGLEAIAAKIREESEETIEAAAAGDDDHTAREIADLLFHLWVLMARADLPPGRVFAVLEERFGVGGLVEKASRTRRAKGGTNGG
jgi:phosphoribosyl-ATP pyrophosphohydrolase